MTCRKALSIRNPKQSSSLVSEVSLVRYGQSVLCFEEAVEQMSFRLECKSEGISK